MPSSRVWPHHSRPRYNTVEPYVHTVVQVALRERPGGPLVFRPASGLAHLGVYLAVCLDDKNPEDCFFVERSLFVDCLPVLDDGQSFFERTDGLTYTKHVIPVPAEGLIRDVDHLPVFVGRACQFRLGSAERLMGSSPWRRVHGGATPFYAVPAFPAPVAGEDHLEYQGVDVSPRVFVRAGADTITFVCLELHNAATGRRMSWTEEALQKACDRYLRQHPVPVDGIGAVPRQLEYDPSGECSPGVEELSIKDLWIPILALILTGVDVDSQRRFSRVCTLWREMVRIYGEHIVILDNVQMWPQRPYAHDYVIEFCSRRYTLLTMLDRAVTRKTTALVLMDDRDEVLRHPRWFIGLEEKMKTVTTVLDIKRIRLSLIVVRYKAVMTADAGGQFLVIEAESDDNEAVNIADDQYTVRAVSAVMGVCDQLVLINYPASQSIICSTWRRMSSRTDEDLLPDSLSTGSRVATANDVGVTIPFLRFRRQDAATEQRRCFLAAANDSCPAVS
ncbi:uncharacterized protein LOC129595746 [Paramacrobiotus metropolitanus]|uniref:uncharacterized protein LOC129595746 n=1 Tax=Paramacrobiotus metropolitanus TaxID=2943436 RepID=UPI0024464A48|nr:uncharacterized protein LOC129595746 [Paramacrobiotus metropolitanus]XP_055348824.1 uncharacterized protein LOC129595746 [Paramacrobiotus metropolitanus]